MKLRRPAPFLLLLALFWLGQPVSGHAALSGVSSIDPTIATPLFSDILAGSALDIPPRNVVLNIGNGFPLWYQDANGRKLQLCLEQAKLRADTQTSFFPCLTAEPLASRPISFPGNIGVEGFYWAAIASGTYSSSSGQVGSLLAVLAHEMTFPNLIIADGEQTVFARIRLRLTLPVPGTYRVTHPFGSRDYVVTVAGVGREINQTQDIGILAPRDFLASLGDGPPPAPTAPALPSISEGVVNDTGASIGPYLGVAAGAPILDTNGNLYLSDPGTDLLPNLNPIEPGPNAVDYFEVTLLDPPAGFFLNAADSSQSVRLTGFQIAGKLFNDAPNQRPVAMPDTATTVPGKAVLIDVVANDQDVRAIDLSDPFNPLNPANTNVHGLNEEAILLTNGFIPLERTGTLTTLLGATVRRVVDAPSGRAKLLYTPGAPGVDNFSYMIQDKGGLISQPTSVSVLVEELTVQRAEFRPRTGKWSISGTTTDTTANSIRIYNAPRALLSGDSEVPPVASAATGTIQLQPSDTAIGYQLSIDPQPDSTVTAVHLHYGNPGENGPILFNLYNRPFDGPFDGSLSGQWSAGNLFSSSANGIITFADAIAAIQEGRAYINLHTVAHPDGELRGQLGRDLIGTAPVGPGGGWSFQGRSRTAPGRQPSLAITSDNGNQRLNQPVKLR